MGDGTEPSGKPATWSCSWERGIFTDCAGCTCVQIDPDCRKPRDSGNSRGRANWTKSHNTLLDKELRHSRLVSFEVAEASQVFATHCALYCYISNDGLQSLAGSCGLI